MAVIVQRMVDARWSGVCFTADPTTSALSVTVVNAVRGLGEKLVSGEVNPEEIKLRSSTGEVLERKVPPGTEGLPDDVLMDVSAQSSKIARAFDFPQDVEWAFNGQSLYVLQSRPITTLSGVYHNRALEPWGNAGDPDDVSRVWTRAYADEIWTPPTSPLFYDLQYLGEHIRSDLRLHGDTAPIPPDIFKYYRAAAYMDSAVLLRAYAALPRMVRSSGLVMRLPPELREQVARVPWRWWGILKRTWKFEVANDARWSMARNHAFLATSWPAFDENAQPLMDAELTLKSDSELDRHLEEIWAVAGTVAPECEIAVFYYAYELKLLLTALMDKWCGNGDQRYAEVSAGLEGSHTVEESEGIWQLAELLRHCQGDTPIAPETTWAEFSAWDGRWSEARDAIQSFLARHRHRGASYKDVVFPRWGDAPEMLWLQVKSFGSSETESPAAANRRNAERRRSAQRGVLDSMRGFKAPARRRVLKTLFKYNEIYMGLRDDHRFYYDKVWWCLRKAYLERGRRLSESGHLGQPEDIFYLVRKEIDQLRIGRLHSDKVEERVASRRSEWLETKRKLPPKFLRSGYIHSSDVHRTDGECLVGMPASTGQVSGRARVVYDISELASLKSGDILVTRQTDPGWTPVFSRLGGLVLETGGVLAHGASLCREFGLPCVTSVEGAMELLQDGDLLILDGGLGTVTPGRQPEASGGEVESMS